MMTLHVCYLIPALASFFWPLYFVLVKKEVTKSQWFMALTQAFVGLTAVVYSEFFNPHMRGEYFLSILYGIMALFGAPLFYLFVCCVTKSEGVDKSVGKFFIIPVIGSVMVLTAAVIAGRDHYRQFLENVIYSSDLSYMSAFGYNVLVFVIYWFFSIALMVEIIWVMIAAVRNYNSYRKILREYVGANNLNQRFSTIFFTTFFVFAVVLTVLLCTNPLYQLTNTWFIGTVCVLASIFQILIGYTSVRIKYTAEDIIMAQNESDLKYGRIRRQAPQEKIEHYEELGRRIEDIVEVKNGYLNHKLSLDDLSDQLGVSQSELIDVLHIVRGCSFSDYVDGLRVNRAIGILLLQTSEDDSVTLHYKVRKTDFLENISVQCGFDSREVFLNCFYRVMGMSLNEWLLEGMMR